MKYPAAAAALALPLKSATIGATRLIRAMCLCDSMVTGNKTVLKARVLATIVSHHGSLLELEGSKEVLYPVVV